MFCRNCGKELAGAPQYCMNCGARPWAGRSHCSNCGSPSDPLAEICLKCHARLTTLPPDVSGKSRTALTPLAFFLGAFRAHRFYAGRIRSALGMALLAFIPMLLFWGAAGDGAD